MKKAIITAYSLFAFVLFAAVPLSAGANVGVSINTGKIILDKSLVPGGTYQLPDVQVSNTGTEASDYGVSIEYNETQQQLKPKADWFHFDPATFHLAPGEVKLVKVSVTLPTTATAGDYFAYIEAHSIHDDNTSTAAVSGAAAAKLYLSVGQSNMFKTGYYGMLSFVKQHAPWTYGALWIIAILIICAILKRIHLFSKINGTKTGNTQ